MRSTSNSLGMTSSLDSSMRIEQWCQHCGIGDVSILALAGCCIEDAERQLRQSIAALCKRCQPGDTVVLHIAGLDEVGLHIGTDGSSLAMQLPSMVTVVCVADSHAS